jgi:hypothetical protein
MVRLISNHSHGNDFDFEEWLLPSPSRAILPLFRDCSWGTVSATFDLGREQINAT